MGSRTRRGSSWSASTPRAMLGAIRAGKGWIGPRPSTAAIPLLPATRTFSRRDAAPVVRGSALLLIDRIVLHCGIDSSDDVRSTLIKLDSIGAREHGARSHLRHRLAELRKFVVGVVPYWWSAVGELYAEASVVDGGLSELLLQHFDGLNDRLVGWLGDLAFVDCVDPLMAIVVDAALTEQLSKLV